MSMDAASNSCETRNRPLFTVFTPTYNRAETLGRPYRSLKAQTLRDFEWVIVDDGSNDGTKELVQGWIEEGAVPIKYHWQENRGKYSTFEVATALAQGELMVTLDSDDEAFPNALERFKHHWESIPESIRHEFAAVTANCVDNHGHPIGDPFPEDVLDSDAVEIRLRYRVSGDKFGFNRTAVLREFPFPSAPDLGFVPEGVVWDAIASKYRTRYVNEVLLKVWLREPGERAPSRWGDRTPPRGYVIWHRNILNNQIRWFRYHPLRFFVSAAQYVRFSLSAGASLRVQYVGLENRRVRLIWAAAILPGLALFLRDRWRTVGGA